MSIKSEGKRETTGESPELFASRKVDHIRLALDQMTQASGGSGIDQIELAHEAFPELDLNDVNLQVPVLGRISASPFFISSMTAGHEGSLNLNLVMAKAAEEKNWLMAVGSQRRQLTDPQAALEWKKIRAQCPRVRFIGNIGLAQLIQTEVSEVRRLADSLEAEAMIVHTNPLQECLQPEGTPQFKGGLQALERLARELGLPVIVKETGCGFSKSTLNRLVLVGRTGAGSKVGVQSQARCVRPPLKLLRTGVFRRWSRFKRLSKSVPTMKFGLLAEFAPASMLRSFWRSAPKWSGLLNP
jgi:isopentenyl diphosphate isomerase/L-lactate dehydrogenase-like FMN-dependent dehydrogenase